MYPVPYQDAIKIQFDKNFPIILENYVFFLTLIIIVSIIISNRVRQGTTCT